MFKYTCGIINDSSCQELKGDFDRSPEGTEQRGPSSRPNLRKERKHFEDKSMVLMSAKYYDSCD